MKSLYAVAIGLLLSCLILIAYGVGEEHRNRSHPEFRLTSVELVDVVRTTSTTPELTVPLFVQNDHQAQQISATMTNGDALLQAYRNLDHGRGVWMQMVSHDCLPPLVQARYENKIVFTVIPDAQNEQVRCFRSTNFIALVGRR